MFKFNFNNEESNDNLEIKVPKGNGDLCSKHEFIKNDDEINVEEIQTFKVTKNGKICLKYVNSANALSRMKQKPDYLNENSDLVKNVYEGGLKIWECSQDLVLYLNESSINIENKSILELGTIEFTQ